MARRTLHAGYNRLEGMGLNLLSEDELYDIHLATMDVLWNTGVKIESDEALHIMEDNGCVVDWESKICKIPEYIVDLSLIHIYWGGAALCIISGWVQDKIFHGERWPTLFI